MSTTTTDNATKSPHPQCWLCERCHPSAERCGAAAAAAAPYHSFAAGQAYDFDELAAALHGGEQIEVVDRQGGRHLGAAHRLERESGGTPCRHFLLTVVGPSGPTTVFLRVK